MTYSIISSDIDFIETLYYQFYDRFYDASPKEAALEVIINNNVVYSNPSWNKVQELHQEYSKLKINYNLEK